MFNKNFWAVVWGAIILLGAIVFIPFPIDLVVAAVLIIFAYKFEDKLTDWLS